MWNFERGVQGSGLERKGLCRVADDECFEVEIEGWECVPALLFFIDLFSIFRVGVNHEISYWVVCIKSDFNENFI